MKSFTPHYEHVASGHLLEPLEILGQVPGNFPSRSNHAIERHRRDRFEVFHQHDADPSPALRQLVLPFLYRRPARSANGASSLSPGQSPWVSATTKQSPA